MATQIANDANESVFQSTLPIGAKLERARTELLDLGARNRLLNTPRSAKNAKLLQIVDERSAEIFRLLVRENRVFTFLPGRSAAGDTVEGAEESDEIAELALPEDDAVDARGIAGRHSDTRLQTRLTPAGLQKRLLDLYYDARTLEEEQGVNILFLALGALKWTDPNNNANVRHAPLLLVPVALDRGNAAEKFKLRVRQEDVAANLSLEAMLERQHGIKLPACAAAAEDFDPVRYMGEVAEAVAAKAGWSVEPDDIVLGFFSFAKFLMYRDLDPETWPGDAKLSDHKLIRALVADGFEAGEPLLDEEVALDEHITPADMVHIVDCDGSQALAVHEVRRGRDLVIQGPPGTGKSQTIANVIAAAVADGKTVLFVAEKMAALEVVKRRLDANGVGDICLELHSNKANKRAVLDELNRTWQLGAPKGDDAAALNARLIELRDRLNCHAALLHSPAGAAGFTPYQVIGQLVRLRQAGQRPTDFAFAGAAEWSRDTIERLSELVDELVERIGDLGTPAEHLWRGIGLPNVLPTDVARLTARLAELARELATLAEDARASAAAMEQPAPARLDALDALADFAARLAGAPELDAVALGSPAWDEQAGDIDALLDAGARLAECRAALAPVLKPEAWDEDLGEVRAALGELPAETPPALFETVAALATLLPRLQGETERLGRLLGRSAAPAELDGVDALARLGERVAAAPEADPEAFAAELWETGVERATDLAQAVATLEAARAEIGTRLTEAAWREELSAARRTLAAHGAGFFRLFSGEWRAANRLVRSFLADPKTPLDQQLALLDALGRGQAALDTIRREEAFGASAFASAWRGERSSAAPLTALADWMRTLRGLGAEPRLIASRRPDRAAIDAAVARLRATVIEARGLLDRLWGDLGATPAVLFGAAERVGGAPLDALASGVARLDMAQRRYSGLAHLVSADLPERLAVLDRLAEGQALARTLAAGAALGEQAFGALWRGVKTDWPRARAAADWVTANLDIHTLAARIADRAGLAARTRALVAGRDRLVERLERFLADIHADDTALIIPGAAPAMAIDDLADVLVRWRDGGEQLSKWVNYRDQAARARASGIGALVDALHRGALAPDAARPHFEMTYFEAVFADQVAEQPDLARFDGELHARLVASFADLDRQRIKQAAYEVVRAHHRALPPPHGGRVGPLGVLRGEMAKKRGHMPIRQLMQKAAPAVQALKPVFMMNPLSVAQFLPPGALSFDLLVMDEASQIQPVDALGAIARCRQMVVVGDPKQLPPTAFFAKMIGNDDGDDDEDGGTRVGDIESILGLCTARGLPTRMLRWHYRSRHESLIAVSNRQFYESKLYIVPSPFTSQAGLGLRFHHIADGIFESGKTRTNPIEAKRVARAIVEHAAQHPDQSLGVVAFSVAQRKAIMDQLEILRHQLPAEVEAFFQQHPTEPFFVKNLENVQGDERDVIFISVGYGPTAPGMKPPMRFGPVGSDGGERRLNVLISRAKRRCEVFSSITDEDIDEDFARSRAGVLALQLFLRYARTGRFDTAATTARDRHDDVFEDQVAAALHARGHQVHRKVGVAGIFIDLAIADPEHPGRYILGIECDGVSYRAARSARDRDRLRRSVLEGHGWIIHRIWAADWFHRPNAELDRLVAAIDAAKAELGTRAATSASREARRLQLTLVERENVTEIGVEMGDAPAVAATPYHEAALVKPSHLLCELHEAPTGALSQLAEQVVAVEGPVHLDEIVARVREAWGLKRAGGRIQEAVARAVAISLREKRLEQDGDFYAVPGRAPLVRDRGTARSLTLRKPEMLPPAELRVAVLDIVHRNFGAREGEIVLAVSRALGFKSTSAQLRDVIGAVIARMLEREELVAREDLIDIGPAAPPRLVRSRAPCPVEQLIAGGESGRLEFKQTLRWDVRQQTVNKKLEEVVVKTIAAFANSHGGTLLIGVADNGEVTGLADDVATLGNSLDKFELHLTNLLGAHFPAAFRAAKVKVSFPTVADVLICRVDVERARAPIYVSVADRNNVSSERFFTRVGNASHEMPASQIAAYVKEHFE